MSDKIIKQSGKAMNQGKPTGDSGYKTDLPTKQVTYAVDHHSQDILEGVENINLCSDSFLSEKKRSSDSKLCELNFKNCISSDLLKRLEESSPIKSNRTFKSDRLDTNYLTNYTDKIEDDVEDEYECQANRNQYKDSHSLFYSKNNMGTEMDKFYYVDESDKESENSPNNFPANFYNRSGICGVPDKVSDDKGRGYSYPFVYNNESPKLFSNPYINYLNLENENHFRNNDGIYMRNNNQRKNYCMTYENLHQKYGFPEEDTFSSYISPDHKKFLHLDENIAFFPKNYRALDQTPTNSGHKENLNVTKQNHTNLFNDYSFNQGVDNLFKTKIDLDENNIRNEHEQNIQSLIFSEEQKKDQARINQMPEKDFDSQINSFNYEDGETINMSNNSKKSSLKNQNLSLPIQINSQDLSKENMTNRSNQNSTKTYINGKSGWTCNSSRIKCNRCGRPQIKNNAQEKDCLNYNEAYQDKSLSSSNKSATNNYPITSNIMYNKNNKHANNQSQKNQNQNLIYNNKDNQLKKKSLINEVPPLNTYIQNKDQKENIISPDISTKANSTDSKKKKKPFVERVGDWVCIKCKNLNFSFRVVCNRCQLTKTESENLFDQYMKNLMNYVKLNEILQNQIFNNSNLNNLIKFSGVNNQLITNLNKNFQQKKFQLPNDPNLLNYLKSKCLNANGFSPKINYSTEGCNSNLGINENYYTENSPGEKLGNKTK